MPRRGSRESSPIEVRICADVRHGRALARAPPRRRPGPQGDRGDVQMKRIAFARIMQESNALSPVPTTLHDFESAHYLTGDALLKVATTGPELAGFFKRAELGPGGRDFQ